MQRKKNYLMDIGGRKAIVQILFVKWGKETNTFDMFLHHNSLFSTSCQRARRESHQGMMMLCCRSCVPTDHITRSELRPAAASKTFVLPARKIQKIEKTCCHLPMPWRWWECWLGGHFQSSSCSRSSEIYGLRSSSLSSSLALGCGFGSCNQRSALPNSIIITMMTMSY